MKKSKSQITGLLSLSNAENYGAVLQSYSLLQFCKNNGYKAEVINYFPKFMKGRYKIFWINTNSIREFVLSCKNSAKVCPFSVLKKIRFIMFRKKYLKNSIFQRLYTLKDEYKNYIVGSDQVWNLEITNQDVAFFLDFVADNDKKNSYAASIGVNQYSPADKKIFEDYICKFSNVSVREKQAAKYIYEETFTNKPIVNIDPVFLTSAEAWRNISINRCNLEDYILIYAFKSLDEAIKMARVISMETGKPLLIVRCGDSKYYDGELCFRSAGPREFLSLIDRASFIVTDSFHGTAFSMIFNKQFYAIPYKGTNSRIENILDIFGLQERLIQNENDIEIKKTIDYSDFRGKLQDEIERSNDYLRHIFLRERRKTNDGVSFDTK